MYKQLAAIFFGLNSVGKALLLVSSVVVARLASSRSLYAVSRKVKLTAPLSMINLIALSIMTARVLV